MVCYRYDEDARAEAARHPVSPEGLAHLGTLVAIKADELGADGVRGHTVCFSTTAWAHAVECLPEHVFATGRISRGDVFDIATEVRQGDRPPIHLFTASFVWGKGKTGRGPTQHRDILAAGGRPLNGALQLALQRAEEDLIFGYAALYGGWLPQERTPALTEPWARIHSYGPAFFTKFLYFSVDGALILDNVLANAVHDLSGLPHLVTSERKSYAWTPYRYAVYLHWMRQTAAQLSVEPALLELTLFRPPEDPMSDEGDAAD